MTGTGDEKLFDASIPPGTNYVFDTLNHPADDADRRARLGYQLLWERLCTADTNAGCHTASLLRRVEEQAYGALLEILIGNILLRHGSSVEPTPKLEKRRGNDGTSDYLVTTYNREKIVVECMATGPIRTLWQREAASRYARRQLATIRNWPVAATIGIATRSLDKSGTKDMALPRLR